MDPGETKIFFAILLAAGIIGIILIYFIISNMSLPTTASFPGEFLILLGSFKNSLYIGIFITFLLIFSTSYNIFLLNRVIFGKLSLNLIKFKDLSQNEIYSLYPVIFFSIILGILCYTLINNITLFIYYIII